MLSSLTRTRPGGRAGRPFNATVPSGASTPSRTTDEPITISLCTLAATAGKRKAALSRQAKRVWRRYQDKGDGGLVHLGRGRCGNREKQVKARERIVARYQERYPDFGPTLAAEHLSREGLKVDHETLRRWLMAQGLWTLQRRRQKRVASARVRDGKAGAG